MTHVLKIEPAVPETIRFEIKKLLEEKGFTYHSGCTNTSCDTYGDTYNEITFSQQSVRMRAAESIAVTAGDIKCVAPIMKHFAYEHLSEKLQEISKPICKIARAYEDTLPDSAEKSAGLRKLLEAKDCLVRAAL